MASEIDICNMALARLGDEATVSSLYPPEGSQQAEHCARMYPMARDSLLELHEWGFATKRAMLAEFAGIWQGWVYAYAVPADCIKILAVYPPDAKDDGQAQAYEREMVGTQSVIYTNQPVATVPYIPRVTDTTKFSPLFVEAPGWLMASYLAGPVIKGDAGMKVTQAHYGVAMSVIARAATADSNQRHGTPEHSVGWIAGR